MQLSCEFSGIFSVSKEQHVKAFSSIRTIPGGRVKDLIDDDENKLELMTVIFESGGIIIVVRFLQ